MNDNTRRGRRLAAWLAAAGCGLWLLVQAVPADAQAARTRPGSSSSSASRGGGSSSSGGGSSSSSGPVSVSRSRPSQPSSGSSPTVVDKRRPRPPGYGRGGYDHYHGHGYGYGYGYWSPYRWSWWTGWSWWYPWGYPYGYGYGYPPPVVYPNQARPTLGALDTDVWPSRTEVWINGQYVGFVDQFDGFPRFLWLEKGTYDVVFYLDGFKTLARQYTIYPGLVIDVEDRLERGESIHPNDLAPKETPRRDARVREESERRAAAEAAEPDWRARVRADREAARDRPERPRPEAVGGDAWLYVRVTPTDAAVYLDGRFLGTARELSDRDTGIPVTPGQHELSVVRPGFTAEELEFDATEDGLVELEVDLEQA